MQLQSSRILLFFMERPVAEIQKLHSNSDISKNTTLENVPFMKEILLKLKFTYFVKSIMSIEEGSNRTKQQQTKPCSPVHNKRTELY